MRIIQANIGDVYTIHKIFNEFLYDTKKENEPDGTRWLEFFAKDSTFCYLALHGRKPLGMVWGEIAKDEAHIEGIMMRRAWRKIRFVRELVTYLKEDFKAKNCKRVISLIPESKLQSFKKKKFLVEGIKVGRNL